MDIDYRHLLEGTPGALRYGPASAQRMEELLARASGCVLGRQGGHPCIDIVVDTVSHRVRFEREADFREVLGRIETRELPVHRDREMAFALFGIGSVLILGIALAMWLKP